MDNELWRWIWTFGAIALTAGELVTAGFFVLPFAAGSILAAIVAWLDGPGPLQWVLFFVGSALAMVAVRILIRRQDQDSARGRNLPVGVNRYIGMEAVVLETIDAVANTGSVRVQTEVWRATVSGGAIAKGEIVTVVALLGTRLVVEPNSTDPVEPTKPAEPTNPINQGEN